MTSIYALNAILCALVVLGLGFALTADWRNIRRRWRAVLVAGFVEHAVLLWGCLEAAKSSVPIESRQVAFGASVAALAFAVLLALVFSWRDGSLTDPRPRPRARSERSR